MRKSLILFISTAALSIPATAAAPPFDTEAKVASMVDLSSGLATIDTSAQAC